MSINFYVIFAIFIQSAQMNQKITSKIQIKSQKCHLKNEVLFEFRARPSHADHRPSNSRQSFQTAS